MEFGLYCIQTWLRFKDILYTVHRPLKRDNVYSLDDNANKSEEIQLLLHYLTKDEFLMLHGKLFIISLSEYTCDVRCLQLSRNLSRNFF